MSQLRSDAVKTPQKQHEDCMTNYNEIKMQKKLRSAQLRTEKKKETVFNSEGPSDLLFGIRCRKGSRDMRCVTLTTPAKTVVRRRSSRAKSVSARIVEQRIDVLMPLPSLEETVAVMKLAPHERVRQRTVSLTNRSRRCG